MSWKNFVVGILLISLTLQTVEDDINLQASDDRVLLELYSESLCPYCHKFTTGPLKTALAIPDIWEIANFRMIPFGNGKLGKAGSRMLFQCQHGEDECQGNLIFSCAFQMFNPQLAWAFVMCLEESQKSWNQDGLFCAEQLQINWESVKHCTNSYEGRLAYLHAGLETKFLDIHSVPTVMINGSPQDRALFKEDPLRYLCLAYKGPKVIPACSPFYIEK